MQQMLLDTFFPLRDAQQHYYLGMECIQNATFYADEERVFSKEKKLRGCSFLMEQVVVPIDKVGAMDKDARFTVVGMVERSSARPVELVSSSLFCWWATLSDGNKNRVTLFISLWHWDSHPKCVRRGDILVCRNCRNDKEKGISLKMPAGCWILVSGDNKDAMPPRSFLTEAETKAVQVLRRANFDVRFDCKFIPQAHVHYRRSPSSSILLLASKPPLYRHLEEEDLASSGNEISLDAVQVVILWPFHDSYWGAVLWDGYGFGSWASCLSSDMVAILQDAVTFCDGWIRVVEARLQVPEFTDRPELLLCSVWAILPKNEDVLYRIEHLGAFGPFDISAPRKPVILRDWHNYVWLCSSCSSSSYWPKTFCFCCGKRFDVMRDAVIEK